MFVQVILLLKSFSTFEVTVTNISLQISSHVLAYSNSCVNPILYALLSPPFLTGFRQGYIILVFANFHINIHNIWKNASCTKSLI